METVNFKEIKGYPKLFTDYIENYSKVGELFNGDPSESTAWNNQFTACESREYHRDTIKDILLGQNNLKSQNKSVTGEIHKLLDPKCVAVVTGQQTGLFWGPLYTIYKALSAVRLAQYLEKTYHRPVIPVFWMEVDDHDFEEVRHFNMMIPSGEVKRFDYFDGNEEKPIPTKFRQIEPAFSELLNEIDLYYGEAEIAKKIIKKCRKIYEPGTFLADGFIKLFREYFPKEPLIFLNPGDEKIKQTARAFYHQALQHNDELHKQIETQTELLQSKRYVPQVTLKQGAVHLFRTEDMMRTRLTRQALMSRSEDQIGANIEKEVDTLSPDVLFRPLLQDSLLPTVAYVGGASEISYFAQLKKAYEFLGVSMPILVPRWSGTVMEHKTVKFLKKMNITPHRVVTGNEKELLQELTLKVSGARFDQQFENAYHQLQTRLDDIRKLGASLDGTLVKMVDKSEQKMKYQLEKIENRFHTALQSANNIAMNRLQRTLNSVIPNNAMQERTFSIMHFLFRYGSDFTKFLSDQVDIETNHHNIIEY